MSISTEFRQQHFQLYQIILPYCTVCTPADDLVDSWHTPVTCEESSDAEYSIWLSTDSVPPVITQPSPSLPFKSILNSKIFRCVTSASETTPTLKAGEGLASRGTMKINCTDFAGDPGPINFSDAGTFFGKLRARNVLEGKKIITHYFSIAGAPGLEQVIATGTSEHFITNTTLSNGVFTLSAKDALKDIEALSYEFPEPSEIVLTADIDASTTTIPVSDASGFVVGSVFRIDDELFRVSSVGASSLTVSARGTTITGTDGVIVYRTNVSSHTTDSTVQPCYVMNKAFLPDVINDLLTFAGLSDYTDVTQWTEEIQEWNAEAYLYGVISEPTPISDIIDAKLTDYLVDMWLDQNTQKVRMSAVTAWKESIRILEEGNDFSDLSITESSTDRFSRAYMYNKKEHKAENDDITNFSRLTLATDASVESSDFYGSVKLKEFEPSDTITINSAQTTVARYVQRYSRAPKVITFTMEERKLADLGLSDIVDIVSRDSQTPSGQFLSARDRAQIVRIQPKLNQIGRQYNVRAISYVPLIASNPGDELTITLTGSLFDVNLFARAGAPNIPINVTFIFDGCTIGSTEWNIPAVRAGAFPAGSRVRIICTNNTKWSAKGGENYDYVLTGGQYVATGSRNNGGDSYRSDGVDTEIYLNYGTFEGVSTSCLMYASGGAGAFGYTSSSIGDSVIFPGGGGSGISFGEGSNFSIPNEPEFDRNANDGSFSSGGNGYQQPGQTAKGGNGGFSQNGGGVSGSVIGPGSESPVLTRSAATLAGGAFKGSNIVVYNLASQSSKLRAGNSDSYVLITS